MQRVVLGKKLCLALAMLESVGLYAVCCKGKIHTRLYIKYLADNILY